MRYAGPCMCGATDSPSCGPAQGYEVIRVWNHKRRCYVWINPEDDEEVASPEERERDEADFFASQRDGLT